MRTDADLTRGESDPLCRLLESSPQAFFACDREGRLRAGNAAFAALVGRSADDWLGRSPAGLCTTDPAGLFKETVGRLLDGSQRVARVDALWDRAGAESVAATLLLEAELDPGGSVAGYRGFVTAWGSGPSAGLDPEATRRAEASLRDAKRRSRALFEGIEEAVFVHALDGRILDANPAATRLLGYSHAELVTMTTAEIDDAEFAAGFSDRLGRQLAGGHLSCDGRHRTRDGRVIPVGVSSSSIDLDGERVVLSVFRDISERIALEDARRDLAAKNAALTLSEARYRQLTEGCLDGVIAADHDGLVTLLNPAAERAFGITSAEATGQQIGRFLPGVLDPEPGSPSPLPRVVGRTVEMAGQRASGDPFPLELSLSAVERGGELQYIGSVRDQSEQQRMRDLLAQSERLASIGLLSAGVAHEINNPLAYVGNNLAVLERDSVSVLTMVSLFEQALPDIRAGRPDLGAEIDDLAADFDWPYVRANLLPMIGRTREGVQRIAAIVANLRGLARTTPPRMESASIPDLLDGALEMLRTRHRRQGIAVEVEHGVSGPLLCVVPQISQVLLNLLVNATQAVESGSRGEGGQIRFRSSTEGGMVVLSISDNGCGIPAGDIPRLFDPFFTTKDIGEGTGLGLALCHGIVTGHGGRIEVSSRPGLGTTFRVLLPRKPS